jgi:hypothetical protein
MSSHILMYIYLRIPQVLSLFVFGGSVGGVACGYLDIGEDLVPYAVLL